MAYTFFLAGKKVGKSSWNPTRSVSRKTCSRRGTDQTPIDNVISDKMTDDAQTKIVEGDIPDNMEGSTSGPRPRALQVRNRQVQSGHLERPDGRVRKALRRRLRCRGGLRDATAKGATIIGGGDTRPPSSKWAWPTRSATSPRAAERRWSSWRTGISRRWISRIEAPPR